MMRWLTATFGCLVVLAACSSFGAGDPPASAPADASTNDAADGTAPDLDGGASEASADAGEEEEEEKGVGGVLLVCTKSALCDRFTDNKLLDPWTDQTVDNSPHLRIVQIPPTNEVLEATGNNAQNQVDFLYKTFTQVRDAVSFGAVLTVNEMPPGSTSLELLGIEGGAQQRIVVRLTGFALDVFDSQTNVATPLGTIAPNKTVRVDVVASFKDGTLSGRLDKDPSAAQALSWPQGKTEPLVYKAGLLHGDATGSFGYQLDNVFFDIR